MADESTDLHEINGVDDGEVDDRDADDNPEDDDNSDDDIVDRGGDANGDDDTSADDDSEYADRDDPESHLADIPDGVGCTEIWEHLSDGRDDE